jgi:hypothetical protein
MPLSLQDNNQAADVVSTLSTQLSTALSGQIEIQAVDGAMHTALSSSMTFQIPY